MYVGQRLEGVSRVNFGWRLQPSTTYSDIPAAITFILRVGTSAVRVKGELVV